MEVRRLRADEWPHLRDLRLRALADAPEELGSSVEEEERLPDEYWQRVARGGGQRNRYVTFAGVVEGRNAGMVGGVLDADSGGFADLVALWVEPEARCRGLGRTLVESVVGWAAESGARRVRAWVNDTNGPARTVYRAAGFEPTGEAQPTPWNPDLRESLLARPLDGEGFSSRGERQPTA
jgi:GNAT superfamily N-acetyltransferase